MELVIAPEVFTNLFHQMTDVMIHRAAGTTDQMKVLIGMGRFPTTGVVGSQVRFPHEAHLSEER